MKVSTVRLKSRLWGSKLGSTESYGNGTLGNGSLRGGESLRMQGLPGFPKTVAFPKWQLRGMKWNLPFMSRLYIIYASSLKYTGAPFMSPYFTLASPMGYMGTSVRRYEGYVRACFPSSILLVKANT